MPRPVLRELWLELILGPVNVDVFSQPMLYAAAAAAVVAAAAASPVVSVAIGHSVVCY